ncbi:MAG: ATP-binding cassette domain-containing protein [Marmoricola sp.]|nr:ATP-binding cassette domain-containing protein [Marmoricola sp.]
MSDVRPAPLVRCLGVGRTFGTGANAVVALHGVTCEVSADARVAVTGPSGSGKTTLVHLLAGLDAPTTGSVEWLPPEPGGGDPPSVGVVFQGRSLIPALTAAENVALPLVLRAVPQADAEERALAALRQLELERMADQLPDELSGGQAQRVAVARVLASRPRLIIADEPTGQLDQHAAEQVVDVLLHTADEIAAGLVVSTHDPHVSGRIDEVWRMHDGALRPLPGVADGPALEARS